MMRWKIARRFRLIDSFIDGFLFSFVLVLNELEGLAKGADARDCPPSSRAALNPEHVARVAQNAKTALTFARSRNPAIRCVTSKGTVLSSSTFTVEEDVPQVNHSFFSFYFHHFSIQHYFYLILTLKSFLNCWNLIHILLHKNWNRLSIYVFHLTCCILWYQFSISGYYTSHYFAPYQRCWTTEEDAEENNFSSRFDFCGWLFRQNPPPK